MFDWVLEDDRGRGLIMPFAMMRRRGSATPSSLTPRQPSHALPVISIVRRPLSVDSSKVKTFNAPPIHQT